MTIQFPRVGERFLERYEITNVLGAGGMSRVYGALQVGLGRKVAIKLLAPAGAENLTDSQFDNIAARFDREAKLISQFRSASTVVMYDYGRSGEYLFMILEYVDGSNLHQLIETTGPLPAPRVARILRQALSSLAEAHQMGILHRDIKPQNIMVYEHLGDPDNTKVLDFGIAKAIGETGRDVQKLTEERTIVGTPSYMSPEQILGHQLSPASDIYSLGLVAYELLFGIVAVEADSAVSTMARHLAPTPIEIPEDRAMPAEFLDILRKMIAKDAQSRYQSCAEVLADLNSWDGGDASLSLPRIMSPPGRTDTLDDLPANVPRPTEQSPDASRPLLFTAVLLIVAIVAAVGVIVALIWMMSAPPESEAGVAAAADRAGATEVIAEPIPDDPAVRAAATVKDPPSDDDTTEPTSPDSAPDEPAAVAAADDPAPAAEPKKPAPSSEKPRSKAAPRPTATESKPEPDAVAAEAVEPPEPLVVTPPQPEPAPDVAAAALQPVPTPDPKPAVTTKPKPKAVASKKDDDEDDGKKKKKKKKKSVPPLSF